MMGLRNASALVGVVAIALTLTACLPGGGGAPEPGPPASDPPSGSPSPIPGEEPVPAPSAIIVDGDSVSVTASEGGILVDIPFTTEPAAAVTQLNDAIGLVATVSTLPATGCFHERQQATWGGLSFIWGEDWQRAPGALFLASSLGPETTSGLKVTLPSGQWIGATEAEVVTGNPSAPLIDNGGWKELHYDIVSGAAGGDPDTYFGAYAQIDGGVLTSFASPIHYFYDC